MVRSGCLYDSAHLSILTEWMPVCDSPDQESLEGCFVFACQMPDGSSVFLGSRTSVIGAMGVLFGNRSHAPEIGAMDVLFVYRSHVPCSGAKAPGRL